jgi:ribosomal protein S18 acetylase RimI-like enzyme
VTAGGLPDRSAVVAEVERAAAATWPSSIVDDVDGWLLRRCAMLQRNRSNSALPPAVVADSRAALESVEEFYARYDRAPVIQVSPLQWHGELDAFLAERGYRAISPTEVMIADAGRIVELADPGDCDVQGESDPRRSWLRACETVGGRVEPSLDRVPRPASFLVAVQNEQPVGVGLFVVSGDWCGVYCLATDPRWRRRGVARSLLRAGAQWAGEVGASGLFLQVAVKNAGALALYRQVGFRASHSYHYRIGQSAVELRQAAADRRVKRSTL